MQPIGANICMYTYMCVRVHVCMCACVLMPMCMCGLSVYFNLNSSDLSIHPAVAWGCRIRALLYQTTLLAHPLLNQLPLLYGFTVCTWEQLTLRIQQQWQGKQISRVHSVASSSLSEILRSLLWQIAILRHPPIRWCRPFRDSERAIDQARSHIFRGLVNLCAIGWCIWSYNRIFHCSFQKPLSRLFGNLQKQNTRPPAKRMIERGTKPVNRCLCDREFHLRSTGCVCNTARHSCRITGRIRKVCHQSSRNVTNANNEVARE